MAHLMRTLGHAQALAGMMAAWGYFDGSSARARTGTLPRSALGGLGQIPWLTSIGTEPIRDNMI
jgi:hypothetical protein